MSQETFVIRFTDHGKGSTYPNLPVLRQIRTKNILIHPFMEPIMHPATGKIMEKIMLLILKSFMTILYCTGVLSFLR